jgi:hypothetical protein
MQLKQLAEFSEREPHGLAPLDESQAIEVRCDIDSIARGSPLRGTQQAPALVEPNGLHTDASGFCELAYAHESVRALSLIAKRFEDFSIQVSLRRMEKLVKQSAASTNVNVICQCPLSSGW